MTLPTGSISFANINSELGRASGSAISLGDAAVRSLAGRTTGSISMSDLRGKSSEIREPATGELYTETAPYYSWRNISKAWYIQWGTKYLNDGENKNVTADTTSATVGSYTYFRGTLKFSSSIANNYGIYRTSPG